MPTLVSCLLGLLLGARHALEPDHLTAISTLVAERRGARAGLVLGAFWGLGHSITLLGAGVLLTGLHRTMPPRLAEAFELVVAVMLIVLGARSLARARASRGPLRAHSHGGSTHSHAGATAHVHVGRWTLATRPLLVGLVHGL